MKTILKVGDHVYGASLQKMTDSYVTGFPQRENSLCKYAKDRVTIDFFRHSELKNIEDIHDCRLRLLNYLSCKKYDYIMVDNPLSFLVIDNSVHIPVLFDSIDWYDEMYLMEYGVDSRYYLLRYAYLTLLEKSQKVIAQSPVLLDSMKRWGLKTSDTKVIPNGYDAEYFYPYSEEAIKKTKSMLSKKHGIPFNGKKIIVYTGKLGKWYENIVNVIEAVTDGQILLIVGDGPLISMLHSRPNVIKCGPVNIEDVAFYTNSADVLVFPVDDCSPIAISEYLAVGKPIVALKGRINWLLENGKTGYLVDNNVESWRMGINAALTMKKTVKSYNLLKSKKLSWEKLSETFVDFIR